MPTTKKRCMVSLSDEMNSMLQYLSERDSVPPATKAVQLIQLAMEVDEDGLWDEMASKRDTKSARFLTHEEAWA